MVAMSDMIFIGARFCDLNGDATWLQTHFGRVLMSLKNSTHADKRAETRHGNGACDEEHHEPPKRRSIALLARAHRIRV